MNNAEAKAIVQAYFQSLLQKRTDRIIEDGPMSMERIAHVKSALSDAEEWIELARNGAEIENDDRIIRINDVLNLTIDPQSSDAQKITDNYNLAHPAMLKELLRFNTEQSNFTFAPNTANPIKTVKVKQHSLGELSKKFVDIHVRDKLWDNNTVKEKQAYLTVLKEILGEQFNVMELDAEKARSIRDIVITIPVNRNKDPRTRSLSLSAAIAVKGIEPIANTTVKKYIDCYKAFFQWCYNEGYIEKNSFQTIKGKTASNKNQAKRLAFSEEQIRSMLLELDRRDIVKKDYAYWGTLIGIYTGARVNEVAQIMLDDIKEADGVWYFDLNDDGEGKKLKNNASRRVVPIHQALLDRGLIEYVHRLKTLKKTRLLHELTYCKKNGFGKNLSRFFNETFLPKLNMKGEKGNKAVFHSLRHTVVTRLTQAGHDEKKIRAIIGHAQSGTAWQTYFAEGYKLNDLKSVIDSLHPVKSFAIPPV